MNDDKKTAGLIHTELAPKAIEDSHTAHDQMREQLTHYEKNIFERIELGKKEFDGDFYIVVITKRERLMDRILRNYFVARKSCPTPQYDEAVYKYHRKGHRLEFLWVIPDKNTCKYMIDNPLNVLEEEYQLRDCVFSFTNGDLDRLAMKLNGEIIK